MSKKKVFTVSQEGYEISAEVELANKDLLVNLLGGDVPHLGGVLTYDHASGEVKELKFYSHDGRFHKDILLARVFASEVRDRLPGNLCVCAGVHVDGISKAQIAASTGMTQELAKQVLAWLKGQEDFKEPAYTSHFK
ncbi:hypothetical protein lacNasYZ03_07400 [Lactobacillus nasalidis]|uniref:Prenylated flavin chaperone LpdD-like domain-containing protein n=1 Tax=Lactobacillus nasalidis TaxID=2797258 RepID=A0ABQ3W3P0_9LACO|nr:hypothetical protein [Lactobacillus nasalidis]GHV97150.1 hypothetical protein lacNasYZ01_03320 [Lactobacillus nasalidis]GHV99137.1 hypothetical protein lacNasYZ02_05670 [Lactobacillus nasalidis]GHW01053.1 hypothetical protein lacNasYZ03_07400 [Lactobacillus nasalidis]